MGLFTGLLTLPLAPVRGVVWLSERVLEQAESEWYDPALIRRRLDELDEARQAGEISDEECAEQEEVLVQGLLAAQQRGGGPR